MDQSSLQPLPSLQPFEEIIDGYFPLQVSLAQMMDRLRASYALVDLSYAPIMRIPDLPHDAPVPLNIREGTAGSISRMLIEVDLRNGPVHLRGRGAWSWNDTGTTEDLLDPMTRLAEPAFLYGLKYPVVSETSPTTLLIGDDKLTYFQQTLEHFGWPLESRSKDAVFESPNLSRL